MRVDLTLEEMRADDDDDAWDGSGGGSPGIIIATYC